MDASMRVKQLLELKGYAVHTIGAGESLTSAAAKMTELWVGSLVVLDGGGGLAGILTWHDVVRAAQKPSTLETTTVGDAMTKEVETATLGSSMRQVEHTMVEKNIRHLPVVDDGKVVGVITRIDVLRLHLSEADALSDELVKYIQGVYQ